MLVILFQAQCVRTGGCAHQKLWFCTELLGVMKFINSSAPGQNGYHFADNIFWCTFVNENFCILIEVSRKFVPKGPIDNIPALVKIMAWHLICDKPLSEPVLPDSLTHICGTRGRWVNKTMQIHRRTQWNPWNYKGHLMTRYSFLCIPKYILNQKSYIHGNFAHYLNDTLKSDKTKFQGDVLFITLMS